MFLEKAGTLVTRFLFTAAHRRPHVCFIPPHPAAASSFAGLACSSHTPLLWVREARGQRKLNLPKHLSSVEGGSSATSCSYCFNRYTVGQGGSDSGPATDLCTNSHFPRTASGILLDVSERDHQSRRPGDWASWGNCPQKLIYVNQIISHEVAHPTNQRTSMSIYLLTKNTVCQSRCFPWKTKSYKKEIW